MKQRDIRQQEIENDRAALRALLVNTVQETPCPENLSGRALRSLIREEPQRRMLPIKTLATLSACLVVGLVTLGMLLQNGSLNLGEGALSTPESAAVPAPMAADSPDPVADLPKALDAGTGETLQRATSVEEIAGWLSSDQPETALPRATTGGRSAMDAGAGGEAAGAVSGALPQVTGIGEADLLAANEKILCFVGSGTQSRAQTTLYLVDRASMVVTAVVPLETAFSGELLLSGNTLGVLTTHNDFIESAPGAATPVDPTPGALPTKGTTLQLYDITDPAAPAVIRTFSQEGEYLSARLSENAVELVSVLYPNARYTPGGPVPLPRLLDTALSNSAVTLSPQSIFLPREVSLPVYTVITSLPLSGGAASTAAVLGACQQFYRSEDALYLSGSTQDGTATRISRFTLSQGQLQAAGTATLPGTLYSRYALDQWQGNLRVTLSKNIDGVHESAIYILDSGMTQVGQLESLLVGQPLSAARFREGYGYLSTLGAEQPLLMLNLNDPKNPTVAGECTAQGFSGALYPLSESLALGVGYDTTTTAGGALRRGGLTLTLFNLSDPTAPKALDQKTFGDVGSSSAAAEDARAFYYDPESGRFGLPAQLMDQNGGTTFSGYLLLSVSDGAITLQQEIAHTDSSLVGRQVLRGVGIENSLYTVTQTQVQETDLVSGKTRTVALG